MIGTHLEAFCKNDELEVSEMAQMGTAHGPAECGDQESGAPSFWASRDYLCPSLPPPGLHLKAKDLKLWEM